MTSHEKGWPDTGNNPLSADCLVCNGHWPQDCPVFGHLVHCYCLLQLKQHDQNFPQTFESTFDSDLGGCSGSVDPGAWGLDLVWDTFLVVCFGLNLLKNWPNAKHFQMHVIDPEVRDRMVTEIVFIHSNSDIVVILSSSKIIHSFKPSKWIISSRQILFMFN